MLDVVSAPNRFVYWVGGPTIRDPATDAGVRQINDVARSVVSRHQDSVYVDAYQLFGDSQGHYNATLPGLDGKPILVRADDGVHFTPDGGDRLARAIYTPLDARCRLSAQAVFGSPKPVIQAPGSTQIPNTFRGGSTSATTPTTRPAIITPSAPPTTQAPASSTTSSSTTTTKGLTPPAP
jgi:hypothetical protein